MWRIFEVMVAMVVVSGCGNEGRLDLAQDSDYFEPGNGEMVRDSSNILCEPSFMRSLSSTKSSGVSPKIEFSSAHETVVNVDALARGATSKQRCSEIQQYLSEGLMKLNLSFASSQAEENQMAQGKAIDMQLSGASLIYSDGALKGKLSGIDLRCEAAFSVSCDVEEMDGQKKCVSFNVRYPDQTCTFKASFLPFGFSDHKVTELDMLGELNFVASSGAQLKFNKISWTGIY